MHPASTAPRPRHASTLTLTLTRCGHCKAMKPAWGEFGKLHAKSAELLVGEVDCTAGGGEELCERFEVEGFPTLKFFEAGSSEPEEFDGDEMSVEGFEAYSKALLGPACSPAALEACSTEDRKVVESYRALSPEARAAEQERLAAPLAAAKKEVKDARDEREFVEKEMEMVSRASLNPNPNPDTDTDPNPNPTPSPNPSPNAHPYPEQVKDLEKAMEELEAKEEEAGERLEELKKSSKRTLKLMERVDAVDGAKVEL